MAWMKPSSAGRVSHDPRFLERFARRFLPRRRIVMAVLRGLAERRRDRDVEMRDRRIRDDVRDRFLVRQLQKLRATLVDRAALLVQHVVVFKEVFAHIKVGALYFFLCLLHRFCDHPKLDRLVLRKVEPLHDPFDAVTAENPKQVVFEREEKLR